VTGSCTKGEELSVSAEGQVEALDVVGEHALHQYLEFVEAMGISSPPTGEGLEIPAP